MRLKTKQIIMKKYTIELTKEQLEKLGLEVPKFELSEDFWEGRITYSVNGFGNIKPIGDFYQNINKEDYETELPTSAHTSAYKIWTRLMMIQYEMNGGEVLDEGYGICRVNDGVIYSTTPINYGIKFKTRELAQQFLEENIEDLEKIKIMGF